VKIIVFALILPVLLIGVSESYEYGGGGGSGGKPDPRVCGDVLCSEIPGGRVAWEAGDETIEDIVESETVISSPRKQMAQGTLSGDVICKEGLVLIIKHNDSAACVRADTALKLEELGWGVMSTPKSTEVSVTSFEECVAAGNPVMESYPRQCRTADGKNFVESPS